MGLECASRGASSACIADRSLCKAKAGVYLGREWPTCPVRSAMDDTHLQLVMQLETASRCSAVSDWPDGYASWVASLWSELRASLADRQVADTGGPHA